MRVLKRWLVLLFGARSRHRRPRVFVAICRDTVSVRWLLSGWECATLLFACVWKGLFVYLRFSSRFWVSQACSRHVMAYSILCFMFGYMSHLWRMLNKGTLHQEGECVFAIKRFQCVLDQVGAVLVAVRDQVPITDRLFFCPSLSCVRVHICWLRGVPCNKLLRVVVQRKRCFVSTFESPPAVDLSF